MVDALATQATQGPVLQNPHRSGPLAQYLGDVLHRKAGDDPEHQDLGLPGTQRGDEVIDRLLRRQRLEDDIGRVLSSRHLTEVLGGDGLGASSSAAPAMVGKATARHGEHPGTQGTLVAGEVLDTLGHREPGFSSQVIGSTGLLPSQIAQEGRLQGIEEDGRRPLRSGVGGF